MTLKEYIEGLQEFAKENPETLDMQVIASKDDEGNGYSRIYYSPTKGNYQDQDFMTYDEEDDGDEDEFEYNAVCVN